MDTTFLERVAARAAAIRKLLTSIAGGLVLVLQLQYGTDSPEVTAAIALATSLGVWAIPNRPAELAE